MDWNSAIKGFLAFLLLERSLSPNSIEAYKRDVAKLRLFAHDTLDEKSPINFTYQDLENFVSWLAHYNLTEYSQARIISGVKSFYKYLRIEDLIEDDPSELLEAPKIRRKIPDVLSFSEVERIFAAVDLSHPQGHRDRSILETIYACGLRASEVVNLKLSNFYVELGIIKVVGKGNKERIIPIGDSAIKFISIYRNTLSKKDIGADYSNYLYVNRRGKKLSRVMIFNIIKKAASTAGINKNVSPHTLRHSFATHLIEGGADLKAVQDMLGHASITTTEIYTHLDNEFLRKTIETYHPSYIRSV